MLRFSALARGRILALVFGALVPITTSVVITGPAFANPVFPPGSRVGITPPVGMTSDAVGARFQDAHNGAVLTVLELPGPAYEQIERGLFAANEPNVTLIKRESFGFEAGLGYLAQVEIKADAKTSNKPIRKWVLLGRAVSGEPTALVTFDVPAEAAAAYPEAKIRETLASVNPCLFDEVLGERARAGLSGWCLPEMLRLDALVQLKAGVPLAEARAQLEHAWDVANEQGAGAWALRCALSLARLDIDAGRRSAAAGLLARALAPFDAQEPGHDLATARQLFSAVAADLDKD